MCEYCDKRKNIKINPSPLHEEDQPDSAVIMDGGMVLFKNHLAFGNIDFDYCPMCGRKLVGCFEYGGYTVRAYYMEDGYANKEILGKDDCNERN